MHSRSQYPDIVMQALIRWFEVAEDDDERWWYTRCLYAYLAPRGAEILYIGKCDGCSVRTRWWNKREFWFDLESERKILNHRVIVGEVTLPEGNRLSRQLLADIESLLIWKVTPWGNIQCQINRVQRLGLKLVCTGAWPANERRFRDVAFG